MPLRLLLCFTLTCSGLTAVAIAGMGSADPAPPERCIDLEETDDPMTIVSSDYSNLTAGAVTGRQGRLSAKTGERGRARMTMTITAEPLIHGAVEDVALAQMLASSAAEVLRKKVTGINEIVAESTQLTRKYQEAAYDRGESWTQARFGGGKMGNRAPKSGERRYFNHSGRFAESIVATPNKKEGSATVNVAANRLDPRTSRNAAEFAFITSALIRLVPELGDPAALVATPEVMKALDDMAESVVFNAAKRNKQLRGELGKQLIDLALERLGMGGLRGRVLSVFPIS